MVDDIVLGLAVAIFIGGSIAVVLQAISFIYDVPKQRNALPMRWKRRRNMATEKRLIDATVLERLGYTSIVKFGWGALVEKILPLSEAPTVDAVEVVRCKDCDFMEIREINGRRLYGRCHKGCGVKRLDDFCSYGERRCDNEVD